MSHFVSIFLLRVLYFNLTTICSIFSVIKKEIYFTITYNLFLDINNIAYPFSFIIRTGSLLLFPSNLHQKMVNNLDFDVKTK